MVERNKVTASCDEFLSMKKLYYDFLKTNHKRSFPSENKLKVKIHPRKSIDVEKLRVLFS